MKSCPLHHRGRNLPYLDFHADAERWLARGEKHLLCPKCGLWIWENLYYEKEAGDE